MLMSMAFLLLSVPGSALHYCLFCSLVLLIVLAVVLPCCVVLCFAD